MPKQINFASAAEPVKRQILIDSFGGIDLSSSPTDVDKSRSPDAPNMMPDTKGNPKKRPGFERTGKFEGRINGRFEINGKEVIHAGSALYIEGKRVWSGMADERSSGQIIKENLYIFDGLCALKCDGYDAYPISYDAYVPTVLISKNADFYYFDENFSGDGSTKRFTLSKAADEITAKVDGASAAVTLENGNEAVFASAPADGTAIVITGKVNQEPGGSSNEDFNLLGDKWKESFLCSEGTEKVFTLSQKNIDGIAKAEVMDDLGEWVTKTEGTDFCVDKAAGKITFFTPPGKTPVEGKDNVIITAKKCVSESKAKINGCRRSIAFGDGGSANRIFVCGNREMPGTDFWCAVNDPTYWPDSYYGEPGGGDAEIMGYSVIDGKLGTHMKPAADGRSIIFRSASLDDRGKATYPVTGFLQGEEAAAPCAFVFMETEPLFITERGVYAATAGDIDGRFYTQNRSYFINRALCAEEGLENAFGAKWKHFYVIGINGKLYLLDTSQKYYGRGEPLSSFQYECYLWTGINARVLWEDGEGRLCFGDCDGNVCRFTENVYHDYSESGNKAINAYWTIPDFSGSLFWRNKTVRAVAVQAAAFPQNKVVLEKCVDGIWSKVTEWGAKICYFAWSALNWAEWTWSGNSTYRTLSAKVKIKKFDKVGFRISCRDIDKAFGLYAFSLEYAESGRYKK